MSFEGHEFGQGVGPFRLHPRPGISRADVVLPDGVLERVEREVIGIADHRQTLLDAGQHLRRGVLLYGPPGTGKTHTVRYLLSRLPAFTVVLLAGTSIGFISQACALARLLQPALVVLEDCDLVAEARDYSRGMENPLLFQVLNEMDGLAEDADVAFLLTTNRADLLEPALMQRPGRVDLAVEVPLPDAGRPSSPARPLRPGARPGARRRRRGRRRDGRHDGLLHEGAGTPNRPAGRRVGSNPCSRSPPNSRRRTPLLPRRPHPPPPRRNQRERA